MPVVILGAESFINIIKQMYNRGEVSLEDYATCLRRYNNTTDEQRKNKIYYRNNEYI